MWISHTIKILLFIWEIREACSIKLSRGIDRAGILQNYPEYMGNLSKFLLI